jgi:hypothetical protein
VSIQAADVTSNPTHTGLKSGIAVVVGQDVRATVPMVVIPPPPPSTVSVSRTSSSYIHVSWSSVPRATSYKVYRSLSPTGSFSLVSTRTSTSFTDSPAEIAKHVYYKVSAVVGSSEGSQSAYVIGWRTGWKFYDVAKKVFPDGVGFTYNLHAFGFRGVTYTASIYAVYDDNGTTRFIPNSGTGAFGYVASTFRYAPTVDNQVWGQVWRLTASMWRSDFRNNNRTQYIAMKIHSRSSINNLNDSVIEWTGYYRIQWVGGSPQKPIVIVGQVSAEESALIERQLQVVPMRPVGSNSGLAPANR